MNFYLQSLLLKINLQSLLLIRLPQAFSWNLTVLEIDTPFSEMKSNSGIIAFYRWPQIVATVARYNWPRSFSCAARWLKRQISCHNKRYVQLSQSRPCTGEVLTNIETCTLLCCDHTTLYWESSGCKYGGKRCSLLWQKRQNSSKILMDRVIKVYEKTSVSNIIKCQLHKKLDRNSYVE